MMKLGDLIEANADELARLESTDNGKLYRDSLAQIRSVPEWLYYFGGLADKIEGRVIPMDRLSVFNYTLREPLGVIGIITPWNTPTLLAMMAAAPAVAAGNCVVIKPSEVASVGTSKVMELAADAGFPRGIFNLVTGGQVAGEALVDHPLVAKISFTGGTATGQKIAGKASSRLVRPLLELGGKSANIVFSDADQPAAVGGILAGIFASAGQSCVAGSRALVERSIYDEFASTLAQRATGIRLGDPFDRATQMGPLATLPLLEKVEGMVDRARGLGAQVLAGGERARVPGLPDGYFYQPTILANLQPDAEVPQEEVFGPVLAVLPFDDEDEALELANGTRYGLAAGIWTMNVQRAHRVARRVEAGTVWINRYRGLVPHSPFGGYKGSGVGRANGVAAVDEYLQTKSVWCELESEPDLFASS
jgi:aldehyde dehydrogenase (NAD+)